MIAALTAILGLALGSFANVLIDRIPVERSIRGRSACDRCRRRLKWWELVPIVSALVLRYRCPTCKGRIAFRYSAVEFGAAALLLLVLWRHGGVVSMRAVVEAFGLLALGVLAIVDLRFGVVPDQISIPAIVGVVAGRLITPFVIASEPKASAAISALGMIVVSMMVGSGFFWLQRIVSRGRWVGDGDTRVGALMGALFAPVPLLLALAASYIVGGSIAAVLLPVHRVERGARIPLVPFLFIGSFITVLWGDRVLRWYGL